MKINKTISIIGGYGALGKWYATFFKREGWKVIIYGRNAEKLENAAIELGVSAEQNIEQAVKKSEVIFISVTIPETIPTIQQIATYIQSDKILIEIASIKGEIINTFKNITQRSAYHIDWLSIHPMFGPGAVSMKGMKILFIQSDQNPGIHDYFWELFSKHDALCRDTSLEEHDQMMARVLGGPHFFNIAFMKFLEMPPSDEFNIQRLLPFAGTTFTLQKTLCEAVLHETRSIYAPIQMENPAFLQRLKEFRQFLDDYIQIIEQKDTIRFNQLFETLRSYAKSDPKFEGAYETLYKLIQHI